MNTTPEIVNKVGEKVLISSEELELFLNLTQEQVKLLFNLSTEEVVVQSERAKNVMEFFIKIQIGSFSREQNMVLINQEKLKNLQQMLIIYYDIEKK